MTLAHPLVKYYISAVLGFYPALRICRRFGLSPAGALLLLVPFLGFVALAGWMAWAGRVKKEAAHA